MLCGWEGNHRSGVAPAMRHRLSGLSTYGLNGHRQGDEPHLRSRWGMTPFTLFKLMSVPSSLRDRQSSPKTFLFGREITAHGD